MRAIILVHAGTLYTSASELVDEAEIADSIEGIVDEIRSADCLVVIDGMLSDAIGRQMEMAIRETSISITLTDGLVARLWGCDNEEPPYKNWTGTGSDKLVFTGQVEAARAIASKLDTATEIIVTGAWASDDDSTGCVNSVADALRQSGLENVTISPSALRDPWSRPPAPEPQVEP